MPHAQRCMPSSPLLAVASMRCNHQTISLPFECSSMHCNHQTTNFPLCLQFYALQPADNQFSPFASSSMHFNQQTISFPPLPAVQRTSTTRQSTCPFACRNGVEVLINTKVESIDADALTLVSQGNEQKHSQTVAYGACVWATGVAMHPLTQHLQQAMPPGTQSHSRCYL